MNRTHFSLLPTVFLLGLALFASSARAQITGSITQGSATTVIDNLLDCTGGRVAGVGTITATDGTEWTVPAETNYQTAEFATDLYNACSGVALSGSSAIDLESIPIVDVDPDGEVITAYIFADNYFELYINETLIGVDSVPFTQFNSSVVRFRVSEPYSIATLLVDWEENLGLGSEVNRNVAYHPGDAGFVASFHDEDGEIVTITDENWKAQTYYISPIDDLDCISEVDGERLSASCGTSGVNDGSEFYAVHYPQPEGWQSLTFDDSSWPNAHTYTNDTVGVDNKPAFTNFTDLFDDPAQDAEFIWTSNLVLDNLVLARTTVGEVPTTTEGDFDEDGELGVGDINQLCAGINSSDANFDLNGDGIVDTGDLTYWVQDLAQTNLGDTDLNGSVEFSDFLTLSDGFGDSGDWSNGDFDCNGTIEFADFLAMSDNFGATAAIEPANVPEPEFASIWLVMALGVIGLRFQKRKNRS